MDAGLGPSDPSPVMAGIQTQQIECRQVTYDRVSSVSSGTDVHRTYYIWDDDGDYDGDVG
jgi:hypothetical protein